jgi:hypothetical protein
MPNGKAGMGIESFSSLNNPKASPISNYFCKGYINLQKYTFMDLSGKKLRQSKAS